MSDALARMHGEIAALQLLCGTLLVEVSRLREPAAPVEEMMRLAARLGAFTQGATKHNAGGDAEKGMATFMDLTCRHALEVLEKEVP